MNQICEHLGIADDASDERLGTRALKMYFNEDGEHAHQPSRPDLMRYKDQYYVVLYNSGGVLAMYYVQEKGRLKRLRHYPQEIVDYFE